MAVEHADILGAISSSLLRYMFPFYFDGAVYVFLVDNTDSPVSLLRLDIRTFTYNVLNQQYYRFDGIRSACFDTDHHQLYILDANFHFHRITMSTGERVKLQSLAHSLQRQTPPASMVYLKEIQTITTNTTTTTIQHNIYLLHGRQFKNHRYSIDNDQWASSWVVCAMSNPKQPIGTNTNGGPEINRLPVLKSTVQIPCNSSSQKSSPDLSNNNESGNDGAVKPNPFGAKLKPVATRPISTTGLSSPSITTPSSSTTPAPTTSTPASTTASPASRPLPKPAPTVTPSPTTPSTVTPTSSTIKPAPSVLNRFPQQSPATSTDTTSKPPARNFVIKKPAPVVSQPSTLAPLSTTQPKITPPASPTPTSTPSTQSIETPAAAPSSPVNKNSEVKSPDLHNNNEPVTVNNNNNNNNINKPIEVAVERKSVIISPDVLLSASDSTTISIASTPDAGVGQPKKVINKQWKPVAPTSLSQSTIPIAQAVNSETSEIAIKVTKNLQASAAKSVQRERLRVLASQSGDSITLTQKRGDIIEVVERGHDKRSYIGHNGYKSGAFSIGNTKTMSPLSAEPPANADYAVCVKDYRAPNNKSLTIMRGDVLVILERTSGTNCIGRMKHGLDGWSEAGEFPLEAVRIVSVSEYHLHSDVMEILMENSERSLDNLDESKDMEKRQHALRERVKAMQLVQDRLLSEVDASNALKLQAELRQQVESIGAQLGIEYFVANKTTGQLLTSEETASPITLLREHYHMIGEKRSFKTDKLAASNKTAGSEIDSNAAGGATGKWEYGQLVVDDIEPSDITEDVALLVRVVRRGAMKDLSSTVDTQNKKVSNADFRRPFACAILKLHSAFSDQNIGVFEKEYNLSLWTTSSDVNFSTIPDFLSKSNNDEELKKNGVEPVPKPAVGAQYQLQISTAFYDQPYKKSLEKWSDLAKLPKAEKLEHKVVLNERKHQLYITLDSGKFMQGKKIEISVRVRMENGDFLPFCLSLGSASQLVSELKTVVYTSTSPVWNEMIHIDVSPDKFLQAHLLFTVRSASSKANKSNVFAFAFLKLGGADQVALSNGDHSLVLYKASSDTISNNYITEDLPATQSGLTSQSDKLDKSKFSVRKNESLKIKSLFHTTQFVQHAVISQLIDWKSNEASIPTILDKFKFVDSISIMRNLTGIIDALFKIYDSSTAGSLFIVEPVALLVYNAIVFIIGLLTDERTNRFKHFKTVLDEYIQNQFSGAMAHKHLLNCLSYHMQDFSSKESAKISSTLKALDYIFQLIVKSRIVFLQQQSGNKLSSEHSDQQWREDISEFLAILNKLMSNNSPQLIVVQTLALRNFANMMKGLTNFFGKQQLCEILCQFIESVHISEKQEHLNSYKLTIFFQILSGPLPLDGETIPYLLPTLVNTMDHHFMNKGEEYRLSSQLLALALESLEHIKDTDNKQRSLCTILKLYPKLMQLADSVMSEINSTPSNISLSYDTTFFITSVLTIFNYLADFGITNKYIIDNSHIETTRTNVRRVLKILEGWMTRQVFTSRWPTMQLIHHRITMKMVAILTTFIYRCSPLQQQMSDLDMWNTFLTLQFSLILSPFLRSSKNRINRHHYISPSIKEIRTKSIVSIRDNWSYMSTNQNHFVQHIVPLLLASLLHQDHQVDELIQDLFFSVMKLDFTSDKKPFRRVETKTIEILDRIIIRVGEADEQLFRNFLTVRLSSFFAETEVMDEKFRTEAKGFIDNINHLLGLLFDFRTLPNDRSFEEERTIATLKMMEYFKDRKDTYIKYLHELLNQHINSSYFTEAGHAFMLHSDLYQWGTTTVPPFTFSTPDHPTPHTFPQETATNRKIRLLKLAVQYLDKGQAWEICVKLIQDLKEQYEEEYNFRALSEVLSQEADFYERILSTERFYSEYFRVGYYGRKFPQTIQGKEFLYKGFELERLSDFTSRILAKFPNAELLKSTSEPTQEILNADAQYLLITIVNPSSREEIENRTRPVIEGTPANSRSYLKRNNVNVFVYSKPFKKTTVKSGNEFADLWIRNHFLITDSTFPTIHRRAEVIKKKEVEVSPVENALNSVTQKTTDLEEMISKYELNQQLNLNPLAMALNGMIDAAVNGGINLYKEAFLGPTAGPDVNKEISNKLALALKKQIDILDRGMQIHSIRCPEEMRGLHEKLESLFPKIKSDVMSLIRKRFVYFEYIHLYMIG
ncbi:DOCK family protein [Heterostelium album PN500]|uniref:DOCK family protein n=1 Tax=Heterostelium pallidum (strain ATCC 26659 / Pp 5 / PN500) TaxID=670386 RepID=D3B002_HETP5|nr:DOCK family protein [Heterostelium album PN500]EFA84626.1 DOCK family protein [Heterostelium album PN500]|eukprot:XP_020436739.1 DOCK family protein [Heterostelium album PN500]